jgi:uncharacterized protein
MSELKETLSKFLTIPGVRLAALVGRDGLMIEGVGLDNLEKLEALGAMGSSELGTAEALGQELDRGSVVGTLMEYENGLVSVDPLGDFAFIVTFFEAPQSWGHVRQWVKKSRTTLLEALDAS